MLRRSYAKFAYLKSLVLHKDQAIRAARQHAKTSLILGRNEPPDRPHAPAALAPPKRSFQRGMTSRL
jgi:hypothetical protein